MERKRGKGFEEGGFVCSKPADSTPIVEPFINTSPSLTFPLTRLRKHTTADKTARERGRERLDNARVIRPVFADRYRCPIDGMEVFPGRDSGVHSRLSRRNDLVRSLNSRSHSLLNGTTCESRERARTRRWNVVNHRSVCRPFRISTILVSPIFHARLPTRLSYLNRSVSTSLSQFPPLSLSLFSRWNSAEAGSARFWRFLRYNHGYFILYLSFLLSARC